MGSCANGGGYYHYSYAVVCYFVLMYSHTNFFICIRYVDAIVLFPQIFMFLVVHQVQKLYSMVFYNYNEKLNATIPYKSGIANKNTHHKIRHNSIILFYQSYIPVFFFFVFDIFLCCLTFFLSASFLFLILKNECKQNHAYIRFFLILRNYSNCHRYCVMIIFKLKNRSFIQKKKTNIQIDTDNNASDYNLSIRGSLRLARKYRTNP